MQDNCSKNVKDEVDAVACMYPLWPLFYVIYGLTQWLKWSCEAWGLTWRSQIGANPIPIPHIQTLRHGVSLSAWHRPWILLGRLQARVRDSISPATALGLQYRRRSSCHTSVERTAGQCHCCTIFVLIPATPEDISLPATTASITLITVSWSWSA